MQSRSDRLGQRRRDGVRALGAGAVPPLPHREEQHHPLDVQHRERRAHPVQRVRERVHEAPLTQEVDELVDRRAIRLQVAVVLLGEVPDEDVQRDVVLGEARGHLDREKRVRPVGDPQRALDGVVVGDGDERHPAPQAGVVHAAPAGCRTRRAARAEVRSCRCRSSGSSGRAGHTLTSLPCCTPLRAPLPPLAATPLPPCNHSPSPAFGIPPLMV